MNTMYSTDPTLHALLVAAYKAEDAARHLLRLHDTPARYDALQACRREIKRLEEKRDLYA